MEFDWSRHKFFDQNSPNLIINSVTFCHKPFTITARVKQVRRRRMPAKVKRKAPVIYESTDLACLDMNLYQPVCTLIQLFRELYTYLNSDSKEIDWTEFREKSEESDQKLSMLLIFDPFLYIFCLFCECMSPDMAYTSPTNTIKAKDRSALGFILAKLPHYFEPVKDSN